MKHMGADYQERIQDNDTKGKRTHERIKFLTSSGIKDGYVVVNDTAATITGPVTQAVDQKVI